MIRTEHIPQIAVTGTAGTGAGSGISSPLFGMLKSIGVAQGSTPHANTDITFTVTDGPAVRTLFTLTNYNTTALTWFNVRGAAVSQINVALVFAGTDPVPVELPLHGPVTVTIAQGGAAATCDVTLVYETG